MDNDEIEGWREMTLDEKKRLREILGCGLSAALPIAADDRDVELARLRAALAEAERDRDEARAEADKSWTFVGNVTDSTLDLLQEIERQRRTTRALVVAARALRQAGWNWRGGRVTTDFMVLDVRARIAQIRLQEKLNSEQAREARNG